MLFEDIVGLLLKFVTLFNTLRFGVNKSELKLEMIKLYIKFCFDIYACEYLNLLIDII